MRRYAAALQGIIAHASNVGERRTVLGGVNSVVAAYLDCSSASTSPFRRAAPETQRTRRNILEFFAKPTARCRCIAAPATSASWCSRVSTCGTDHCKSEGKHAVRAAQLSEHTAGDVSLGDEGRAHSGQPDARRDQREGQDDRIQNVVRDGDWALRGHSCDWHKGRLAFALLLYTGQRRSDVVMMGPQAIQQGILTIDQGKTEGGEEAHLEIPVHPKLRQIIDAPPTVGATTFLVTHFGKPYTPPGFGNWFRELCDAAGCQ